MRASSLTIVLALAGCDGLAIGDEVQAVCTRGDAAVDASVFAALTATSWYDAGACNDGGGLPPTCNRLRLGADGRFAWTATSDYTERDDAGAWNFRARDTAGGVVCLDDGSVVDFALTEHGLRWGLHGALAPDEAQPARGDADDLPAIAVDPLFHALVARRWVKTNELDRYREPSSFALFDNGMFHASYRDGACEAMGTFSLLHVDDRLELAPRADPNACDLRDGGTSANVASSNDLPTIVDGVLELYASSYRDAEVMTDERSLVFGAYGGDAGLTVRATWTGALRPAATTTWALALANDSSRAQAITHITISTTPLALADNGFTSTGPTTVLVDRPLAEMVAPGAASPQALTFTPPAAAWASLVIDIASADERQSYSNRRSYVVELAP